MIAFVGRYKKQWWISLVTEIGEEEQDAKLTFSHPHGTSRNFRWPKLRINVCCKISALNNIQLLDEAEQNIVIYQWRADQLFASAFGIGK